MTRQELDEPWPGSGSTCRRRSARHPARCRCRHGAAAPANGHEVAAEPAHTVDLSGGIGHGPRISRPSPRRRG